MGKIQTIMIVASEDSKPTQKGDKTTLKYEELVEKSLYLDKIKFPDSYKKGEKLLITVSESDNKDGTTRVDVKKVEKLK